MIAFTKAVSIWNKEVFGNIFWKKRNLAAQLKGIQCSLASCPNDFLVTLEKKSQTGLLECSSARGRVLVCEIQV